MRTDMRPQRAARLAHYVAVAALLFVWDEPEVAAGKPKPQPQPQPSCSQQNPSPAAQPRRCSDTVFNRLYAQVKMYCKSAGEDLGCKKQTDTCESATKKVSLAYGCLDAREVVQQQCYRPGDEGYKGHMKQIAQVSAMLRNCLDIQEAKCQ
jgi:hypothetical protein